MLTRIALAVLVAFGVGLLLMFLGGLIATINAPITEFVGKFLEAWGWAIGVLCGLWFFFAGGSLNLPRGNP